MRIQTPLETPRLTLRSLADADVTDRYLGWLQDPDVIRFLELRFGTHTIESTRAMVAYLNDSTDSLLLGIFLKNGLHIGNIKLGPISPQHKHGDIGLLLGERAEWGKGYASEAIAAISAYGFDVLGLVKIAAGCYSGNHGSLKAFLKVGFLLEGRQADHWITDTGFEDELLMGLTAARYRARVARRAPRTFERVQSIAFIGGGDVMISTAREARALGYRVAFVLAPRHAQERLPLAGVTTEAACRALDADVVVIDDINAWPDLASQAWTGADSIALCFGPAWVFSEAVTDAFGSGMLNFNGIPIPEYVGGAHYTWQILNGNRSAGCFLQEITRAVDQGDILRSTVSDLPAAVRTPQDYFVANDEIGSQFLRTVLRDFKAGVAFSPRPLATVNDKRLYFPRLLTMHNAFLDWSWTGSEIEAFCRAFDDPYIGAATFLDEQEVRLKSVAWQRDPALTLHPYAAGLVVRRQGARAWIAAGDGLLTVDFIGDAAGNNAVTRVKEGQRLVTPPDKIFFGRAFRPRITAS